MCVCVCVCIYVRFFIYINNKISKSMFNIENSWGCHKLKRSKFEIEFFFNEKNGNNSKYI
jgi:hypothetical protein